MANSLYNLYETITNPSKKINVLASGKDLENAKNSLKDMGLPEGSVNFYDINDKNYSYVPQKGDYILGDEAVTGPFNNAAAGELGLKRLSGSTAEDTNKTFKGELYNLYPDYVKPQIPGTPSLGQDGYYSSDFMPYQNLKSLGELKQNALSSLMPDINMKKDAANSTLLKNLQAIDESGTAILNNTDKTVKDLNKRTDIVKNNASNSALGRGIARSSIIQSDLSGADNVNSENIKDVYANRDSSLANLQKQADNEKIGVNNYINTLEQGIPDQVNNLANTMYNNQYKNLYDVYGINNNIMQNKNALTSSQAAAKAAGEQQNFENSLALSRLNNEGSGNSRTNSSNKVTSADITSAKNDLMAEVQNHIDNRDSASLRNLIDNEKDAIIKTFGLDTYNNIKSLYWQWMQDPESVLYPGIKKPNSNTPIEYKYQ